MSASTQSVIDIKILTGKILLKKLYSEFRPRQGNTKLAVMMVPPLR